VEGSGLGYSLLLPKQTSVAPHRSLHSTFSFNH
jgi:hypothetical protein